MIRKGSNKQKDFFIFKGVYSLTKIHYEATVRSLLKCIDAQTKAQRSFHYNANICMVKNKLRIIPRM